MTITEVRKAIKEAVVANGDVVKGVVAFIENCIVKSLNPKGLSVKACYPFGNHCSEGMALILQFTAYKNKHRVNQNGVKQQCDWIPYACNYVLNQTGYDFEDFKAMVNKVIDNLYKTPWSQDRSNFKCSDEEYNAMMDQAAWMKAMWWKHQIETYHLSAETMWKNVHKHIRNHLMAHTDAFSSQAYAYLREHGYEEDEAVKAPKTEISKEAFANAELLRSLGL